MLTLPVDEKAAKLRRSFRLSPHSEKYMKSGVKKKTILNLTLVKQPKPDRIWVNQNLF